MAAATILEALKSITAFPVPLRTLVEVAERRGLLLSDEATQEVLTSKAFNLAKADTLLWLSIAPNITQGGQSYSFTDEQRTEFKNRAYALFNEYEEEAAVAKPIYGYKGSRL